jgi:hypothetical protein
VKVASRACAADRRQPARVEAPTRAHRAGAFFLTMAAGSWPGALKAPGFSVSIVAPSMRNIHRIFYRNRTRTGVGRKRQRHRQSRAVAVARTREADRFNSSGRRAPLRFRRDWLSSRTHRGEVPKTFLGRVTHTPSTRITGNDPMSGELATQTAMLANGERDPDLLCATALERIKLHPHRRRPRHAKAAFQDCCRNDETGEGVRDKRLE